MSKICEIDTSGIDNILENLNDEKRSELIYKSLIKGGEKLVEDTKSELLRVLPNASRGQHFGKPMSGGIKMKKDKDYQDVAVHIMSDFRLKFFEMGTDDRYLKKPLPSNSTYKYKSGSTNSGGTPYRGRIEGKHFFQKARDNADVLSIIESEITKEIEKIIR